jgi:hypothetical protein
VRFNPVGFLFDGTGTCAFFESNDEQLVSLGLLNTNFVKEFSKILNPTMAFQAGDFGNIPIVESLFSSAFKDNVSTLVSIAKNNWDSFETSWDFSEYGLLWQRNKTLESSFGNWRLKCDSDFMEMKHLEEKNNKILNEVFQIQEEFSTLVPDSEITLIRADREKDSQRLISYAIGCMMGRYSLDEPGLIYAHAGNVGFEPGCYGWGGR